MISFTLKTDSILHSQLNTLTIVLLNLHYLDYELNLVNIDVLHLLAISLDLHGTCIMSFCNPPLVLVHQVDHHLYILPVKKYM